MEKNVYETYEFLQTTSPDPYSNQFFVLHDDGTILSVNKEIQFITQTENSKDTNNLNPAESSAVFDVPTQQYYVEFEGNAPEFISLNDQYAITNGDTNVYANSYLLQPEDTSTPQQMETEAVIHPQKLDAQQMQQLNIEAFNGNKETADLTEITLTDDQYQILEQRGWLLLEANNKVFVLNTLGLHDITVNEKLIQRLKSEDFENDSDNGAGSVGQLKIENVSGVLRTENTEEGTKNQVSIVEYFINNNMPINPIDNSEQQSVHCINNDNVDEEMNVDEPEKPIVTEVPVILNDLYGNEDSTELPKKCDSIKIKTKYTFTDIPSKIFLGKTVNGKNLYAKVKKKTNSKELYVKKIEKKSEGSVLDAAMLMNIIKAWFRRATVPSAACVNFAEAVVAQLLRLPNLTDCIVQSDLVITKVITSYTDNGRDMGPPTMVTGFMEIQNNDYVFTHAPYMLRDILEDADPSRKSSSAPKEKTAGGLINLFHIHISESRYADKLPETAIHLCKRKIPIDALNDAKKRHPNPAFACGTCGTVFRSEQQLKDHQDDECIEVEDGLTIDYTSTDDVNSLSSLYTVIHDGKEKIYSCSLCETKFTRLYNCKKHIKAHQAGKEKKLRAYKCKMCPNTYFHSATLSKHIVKTHLQVKLNK